MPDPIDSFATHPVNLTPAERTRAVAALLALGLLRRRNFGPVPTTEGPLRKVSESSRNALAVPPEQSVTVSAG